MDVIRLLLQVQPENRPNCGKYILKIFNNFRTDFKASVDIKEIRNVQRLRRRRGKYFITNHKNSQEFTYVNQKTSAAKLRKKAKSQE